MAEFVAILGATAATTQFAGQNLSGVLKIHNVLREIKGAPDRINDLVEYICLLSEIVEDIEKDDSNNLNVMSKSLVYVGKAMRELETVLEDLEKGIQKRSGLKGKLQWESVKAAFKEEALENLVKRIDRATRTVELAVNCHNA